MMCRVYSPRGLIPGAQCSCAFVTCSDIVHSGRGFRFPGREVAMDVTEYHGGIDELLDKPRSGRPALLNAKQQKQLAWRIQAGVGRDTIGSMSSEPPSVKAVHRVHRTQLCPMENLWHYTRRTKLLRSHRWTRELFLVETFITASIPRNRNRRLVMNYIGQNTKAHELCAPRITCEAIIGRIEPSPITQPSSAPPKPPGSTQPAIRR